MGMFERWTDALVRNAKKNKASKVKPDLELIRLLYLEKSTHGYFKIGAARRIYTVELPWLDNKPGKSCIPEGDYTCVPGIHHTVRPGKKPYKCIEIEGVDGRSQIEIHPANKVSELRGCIAPNRRLILREDYGYGESSAPAFHEIMKLYYGKTFTLRIRSVQ